MALPMPRDAPVTSATFPFSEISTAGRYRPSLRAGCRRGAWGAEAPPEPPTREVIRLRRSPTSSERGRRPHESSSEEVAARSPCDSASAAGRRRLLGGGAPLRRRNTTDEEYSKREPTR